MANYNECRNNKTGAIYQSQAEASRKLGVSEHAVKKLVTKIRTRQKTTPSINFSLQNLSADSERTKKERSERDKERLKARLAVEEYQERKRLEREENYYSELM